jgi:hypothetical protein
MTSPAPKIILVMGWCDFYAALSTNSASPTTVLFLLGINGSVKVSTIKYSYLLSSGCTATTTSPRIVSNLVVATTKEIEGSFFKRYLNSTMTPTSALTQRNPTTSLNDLFSNSSCSTSLSESAIRRKGHQFTNLTSLLILPFS